MPAFGLTAEIADKIRKRKAFTSHTIEAYVTRGGTYMLATPAKWNDDGLLRDVIAVHPAPLEGKIAVALRPTVSPEYLAYIESIADDQPAKPWESAKPGEIWELQFDPKGAWVACIVIKRRGVDTIQFMDEHEIYYGPAAGMTDGRLVWSPANRADTPKTIKSEDTK